MIQASRAINHQRKIWLVSMVEQSLTAEELKYEESKKILNLFHELTNPELIWLIYFYHNPTSQPGPHSTFYKTHHEILKPISRDLPQSPEQREKLALQDSYKETLLRLGLTRNDGRITKITALGTILVKYITD